MSGHRNAWNAPKKAVGECLSKLPAIDSKHVVRHCIMHKLHDGSEKVLWQRFRLDVCTKQVVSARACAYQLLPITLQVFYFFWRVNCAGR